MIQPNEIKQILKKLSNYIYNMYIYFFYNSAKPKTKQRYSIYVYI